MAVESSGHRGDPCELGVNELGRLYRRGELSPVEATRAVLDRITRLNPELNAYLTVLEEQALAAARAAELQFGAGIDLGPLQGIPVSVKDNIRVKSARTTAASRVLLDAPIDECDAPVVRRLRAAGAVLVGKTNLHEFANGAPDPEGPFGNVQNPRRIGHHAGISSSGSGAAVAAGLGVVSLGTDTGGSIRHPASVCGVVGLKPTYGLVPTRGVIPVSVHLDVVGPLGRSVADVAAGLGAIAGHDPADPSSALVAPDDYVGALGRDVRGLRLGLPSNRCFHFGRPEALALLERARASLAGLGLAPTPVELPLAEETLRRTEPPYDITTLIFSVDLLASHERYSGREGLYGRHLRERLQVGREISATQYARAREKQAEIRRRWLGVFEHVDLLVLPANVAGAPPHGSSTIEVDGTEYPAPVVTAGFNRPASLTGFPALVLPVGETPEGLPVGMQLVGPPFGESRLLAVGHALESALGELVQRWGIEPRQALPSSP